VKKIAPECSPTCFGQDLSIIVTLEKVPQNLGSATFNETAERKRSPSLRKFAQSGVDVMITAFRNFCQFLAKNWRLSQKPTFPYLDYS
jgi:hypothetical protein